MNRQRDGQTGGQTEWTDILMDGQTDRWTGSQMERLTDRQMDGWVYRQVSSLTDGQSNGYID